MFTAGQEPLPRRRVLAAGALGITTATLPGATAAASSPVLTAETAVSSVTVTASEAGTFTATWDDSAGFTHDLVLQRTDGSAETLTDVTSPLTVTPSDWTATDDGVTYAVYVASRSGDTTLNSAPSNVTLRAAASGGAVTTITGDGSDGTVDGAVYRVHTFTAGGTLSVAHARSAEYLLVGGGGGGGTRHGGGGGGGGVLTGTTSLTVGDAAIVVGTGGTGMSADGDGADGGDTTAFSLTADGGGRGGGTRHIPSNGGSGGGSNNSGTTAGAATSGQGSAGGAGMSGTSEGGYAGGGGGGAGGAGGDAAGGGDDDGDAGAGGDGTTSAITGASVVYGGGGGGSLSPLATGTAGAAGDGGGGAGGAFGWKLYDASDAAPTLAWTLLTHDDANPTSEGAFDELIRDATIEASGRTGLTSQSNNSTLTKNVLNWTSDSELETVLGLGDVVSDNFALVVTGTFIPQEDGRYWFTLESDDASDLRLGATTVVSYYNGRGIDPLGTTTGSIELTAGEAYDLRVRMQEGAGDAGLRLFWQKPSQRTESTSVWHQNADELPGTSPNTAEDLDRTIAGATATAEGLAAITSGTAGVDAGTNVLNWASAADLATATGVAVPNSGSSFALVVAGTFLPDETGDYTFTLVSDDAGEVAIDGDVIVSHYGAHPPATIGTRTGTVALTRGLPVRLRVRVHQASGGASARIFWQKESESSGWHHDATELTSTGRAGTDGLGGGGGAGGFSGSANADGGGGGDGVVIVRYRHDAT